MHHSVGGSTRQRGAGSAGGRLAPLKLSLPVDPSGLSGARRALGDWLGGAGVSRPDIDDVLIAANEACMNAVEHSGTPPAIGIRLLAREDAGRLWLEVQDSGSWREPTERADRGHGLSLMDKLTDRLAIERKRDGTKVVMEKALSFGDATRRDPGAAAEVATERYDGICVAHLSGEIDLACIDRVETEREATECREAGPLVVDLSEVGYLDSAGVHMLYRLGHRRRSAGARTAIVSPDGPVRSVLELTNMAAVMPLAKSVDEAVELLGS